MRIRLLFSTLFLFSTLISLAQIKMTAKDMNNLVAMSQIYSQNPTAQGYAFIKSIDSLRTPLLTNLADAMIMMGRGDASIFNSRFLNRPANFEMTLWYVVREIHYNRTNKKKQPRPDMDIAREVLPRQINERWLLDNYYYRILGGGIGTLLNITDLSNTNINLDGYGLKDSSEKAIFYLNMIEALVGARFKPLLMRKDHQKILDYCYKLPSFNGNKYYFYKGFEFGDFPYMGFEKMESYFERHIDKLYNVMVAQYNSTTDPAAQQEIYYNSIMSDPKYFMFSALRDELQGIYDAAK